jgi:hypothetical protein
MIPKRLTIKDYIMKKINLLLFLFVLAFTACEKEQDMYTVLPVDQVKAPVLAAHENISVTANNYTDNTAFKWQIADFGVPTAAEYSLYTKTGNYEAKLITSAFGDSLSVSYLDIAKALYSMPALADKPGFLGVDWDVQFYLVASISATYETVQSNSITLKVNIAPDVPLYPDNVYMIGQDFGGWNWGDAGVVEMTPVHSHAGQFWTVRYFIAANGFKWCNVKDWNGDFFSIGTNVGFTTNDGNAFVASDGFYTVLVDYTNNTITIEPARVYGMGDCFGSWNTGQYPFTANADKTMSITTTGAGEVRMYAASSATDADWWQMEFVILNGKIAYRGTGDDQERVQVAAGKTVTLDFNAGTGTIE